MELRNERWTTASLGIASKEMSTKDISDLMETEPNECFLKGELYSKRNPESKVREENFWLLDSKLGDQATIESHIEYFLSFFREKAESIDALKQDCEFAILCAYSSESGQGGFTLDHAQLKELAEYPVDLSINLYPPEEMR